MGLAIVLFLLVLGAWVLIVGLVVVHLRQGDARQARRCAQGQHRFGKWRYVMAGTKYDGRLVRQCKACRQVQTRRWVS